VVRQLTVGAVFAVFVAGPLAATDAQMEATSAEVGVRPDPAVRPDPPPADWMQEPQPGRAGRTWEVIRADYREFYSQRGLLQLGAGLVAAGALANTDADQAAYDWYHGEVGASADDAAEGAFELGEPVIGVGGALLGVAILGMVPKGDEEGPFAAWVRRTARGYVVGLPATAYLQQMVGSGRPDEPEGSQWQTFGETHGVSGHAFLAAVPFLTLVRQSDNRVVEAAALLASMATAWGRIHQEEHYPSQAFLGWYLAWTATGAVARADAGLPHRRWSAVPVATPGGGGVLVHASF
jgi:hypothetical protein